MEKGDLIPHVELAIPYVDFFVDANKKTEYTKGILDYLQNHMWAADNRFEGNFSTTAFIAGVGNLGNYHALIANVDWLQAASFLREREEFTEPGKPHLSRGAISNIYNLTMVATQRIPIGMELFPDFGDKWDKETPAKFQETVTRKDISEADQVSAQSNCSLLVVKFSHDTQNVDPRVNPHSFPLSNRFWTALLIFSTALNRK